VDDGAAPVQLTPVTVDFAVPEYEGHMPASNNLRTFSGKSPAFVQDTSRPAAALCGHGRASATCRRDLLRAAGYGASLVGMMSTPLAAQGYETKSLRLRVTVWDG
jgi:hypothetical protein